MAKRNWIRGLLILAGIAICLEIVGYGLEVFSLSRRSSEDLVAPKTRKSLKEVEEAKTLLVNRIKSLSPRGIYIVIDTAENRLNLMNGPNVVKEVVVSCGSGDILQEPGGARKWIFDTPRGEFSVSSKLVNPTWIKPDWAFIEEGERPPQDYNKRIDNDSLGDYALGFGDGYFIHGTLYTRLLGRNVTHGCVRVGDKYLKEIFQTVVMGTKVFIF